MHDLAYDAVHDEIVVTSPLTQAILTFRGGANGEEAPIRVIQGAKTGIIGVGATGKLGIDPTNNMILLATPAPRNELLFFARESNGDVAPVRKIVGPDTQLSNGVQTTGGGNVPAIRVDPIHNQLLITTVGERGSNGSGSKVLIFDRNASGNVKPKAIIAGPVRTGNQFEVYGPTRLLISHSNDTLEARRIPESGESHDPPVLSIRAPLSRASADTGIALDPAHKEVIIATAAGNTIVTFSVPEIFEPPASTTSSR